MFNKIIFLSLTCSMALSLFGQQNTQLRIDDDAPPFKYSKWLKGTPINSYDPDHIYVVEFWATWCGPCRAAMPHLTELQKKYQGKVSIVGVDIWEDGKVGKPHDQYIPKVEKFVKENDDRMQYAVFIDNNEQYMGNYWMKAAGQEGIPSTFVIKNGKVVWIGNPMALDSLLPKIILGGYDMMGRKAAMDEQLEKSRNHQAAWKALYTPVRAHLEAQEYNRALQLIDELLLSHPEQKLVLTYTKLNTLLKHVGVNEGIALGNEWIKEEPRVAEIILNGLVSDAGMPREVYLWSAKAYEAGKPTMNPFSYHRLARVYAYGGDFKNAVKIGEKAVRTAESIFNGENKDRLITTGILEQYKQALAGYKKGEVIQVDGK